MFTIRCESCGEEYHADERHEGRLIKCTKCGRTITIACPKPSGASARANPDPFVWHSYPDSTKVPHRPLPSLIADYSSLLIGLALFIMLGLYFNFFYHPQPNRKMSGGSTARSSGSISVTPALTETPAETLQDQIISHDAGRLGDPQLNAEFKVINAKYFSNALPAMPVMWEPRLGEGSLLSADGSTLEGLAAEYNHKQFILINPSLRNNPQELRRALCHEMVHELLFTEGDAKTNHGPAFQRILRRLSEEGAFKGKWASPDERANLEAWLHRTAKRLESESSDLATKRKNLDLDRAELSDQLDDLNARISAANDRQSGWPTEQEIEYFKSRRDALNQQAREYNTRIEESRKIAARYNREAHQFNLMMAYPDGLYEDRQAYALTPEPVPLLNSDSSTYTLR
jgi:SprT-like family